MPPRTTQNPSALIRDVPVLDGTSLALPEADHKDAKPITQGSQRVYYAEESGTNWDALSDVARATLKMTIHVDLAIRYKDLKPAYDASRLFWCARHDPSQPIARWIAKVRNTASDLKSVKLTPADQQICDRLLRGLDDTWKPIRDHLVYSPNEISLDDAIGALEAHKVSTQISLDHTADSYANAADAKPKKKLGCWRCGQTGHHSATCSNPPLRQSKAAANAVKARAGATSVAPLGNGVQYLATTLNRYEKLNIGEK
ncbi:hypothetical protein KEM48_007779 [Puccinia striiformis f. sp. tritici PST-130]|nr:hypothetical protein KEM48_007779 [Puccinia striiformis f. sp. tritici PST-130]